MLFDSLWLVKLLNLEFNFRESACVCDCATQYRAISSVCLSAMMGTIRWYGTQLLYLRAHRYGHYPKPGCSSRCTRHR